MSRRGVGLSLGVGEAMDVLLEFRTEFLGLPAAAEVGGVKAADAGAEFVDPGIDGITPPAEGRLSLAGGAVAVFVGHLRLELPSPMV